MMTIISNNYNIYLKQLQHSRELRHLSKTTTHISNSNYNTWHS